MDNLQNDAILIAHMANAISKAIHGGIWSAWDILQAILAMKDMNLTDFKSQVAALVDPTERKAVEDAFVGALSLQNADVQSKIVSSVNVLETGVQLVQSGIALYNQMQTLIAEAKSIIGQ